MAHTAADTTRRRAWFRSLSVGAASLLVALVAARATSSWIALRFPDRPLPPDLLFEMLPHVPKLGYVADIAVVAALALLVVHAFRGNQRRIPAMMTLFGLMQAARAFLNVLTPLASPLDGRAYYGISVVLERALRDVIAPLAGVLERSAYAGISVSRGVVHVSQNGEFPSGHMASVFLCMLLIDKSQSPRIRAAVALIAVAEALALLMSHQHYSIDVVGGVLLSYWVYHEFAEGRLFGRLKRLVG